MPTCARAHGVVRVSCRLTHSDVTFVQAAFAAAAAMMRVAGPASLLARIQELKLEPKRRAKLVQLAAECSAALAT